MGYVEQMLVEGSQRQRKTTTSSKPMHSEVPRATNRDAPLSWEICNHEETSYYANRPAGTFTRPAPASGLIV
jgi:hypothetical protein